MYSRSTDKRPVECSSIYTQYTYICLNIAINKDKNSVRIKGSYLIQA